MRERLPAGLAESFEQAAADWRQRDGTRRLFERDAALWTGGEESRWLGWLDAPAAARAALPLWREIAADARGFRHALIVGMGGSSLAPEVQRRVLPPGDGHPELLVLDSTHPDAIADCERRLDLARTLVVVASKSGSTFEPNLLMARLLESVAAAVGAVEAPRRFVAVTDPGSRLERFARERGFRRVVAGEPSIGGRFSALSPFGLVAAAIQGLDLEAWLHRADRMALRCRDENTTANPGVALGLLLGAAAAGGRDKLTLVIHPGLAPLGAWLEQLLAESTGKAGRGVLPFTGEPLGAPAAYGDDRIFVALRLAGGLGAGDDERLEALAAGGQPVLEIDLRDPLEIAAEFYRWEVAAAVAGALLGVDPFDQPDVESAKEEARRLGEQVARTGALPAEAPLVAGPGGALYVPGPGGRVLLAGAGPAPALHELVRAHLGRLGGGDYFALLLFCPDVAATAAAAERLRRAVRDHCRVAASVGFGPRYLHSTGQAHKGGPPTGVYLLVTDTPAADLPVPGQRLSFGQAIAAQARGDAAALAARARRVARLELDGPAAERWPAFVERLLDGWPANG